MSLPHGLVKQPTALLTSLPQPHGLSLAVAFSAPALHCSVHWLVSSLFLSDAPPYALHVWRLELSVRSLCARLWIRIRANRRVNPLVWNTRQ